MKDSARMFAAALLGAGIGLSGTAVHAALAAATPGPAAAVSSAADQHVDARFDRLEKQLSAVTHQISLDIDAARQNIELSCGHR